jgi:hypothetical protein
MKRFLLSLLAITFLALPARADNTDFELHALGSYALTQTSYLIFKNQKDTPKDLAIVKAFIFTSLVGIAKELHDSHGKKLDFDDIFANTTGCFAATYLTLQFDF